MARDSFPQVSSLLEQPQGVVHSEAFHSQDYTIKTVVDAAGGLVKEATITPDGRSRMLHRNDVSRLRLPRVARDAATATAGRARFLARPIRVPGARGERLMTRVFG